MTNYIYNTIKPGIKILLDKETFEYLSRIKAKIYVTNGGKTLNFNIYPHVSDSEKTITKSLIGYLFKSKDQEKVFRINTLPIIKSSEINMDDRQYDVYDFRISNFKNVYFNPEWHTPKNNGKADNTLNIQLIVDRKMRQNIKSLSDTAKFDLDEIIGLIDDLSKSINGNYRLVLNMLSTKMADIHDNKIIEIAQTNSKISKLQSELNREILKLKRLKS